MIASIKSIVDNLVEEKHENEHSEEMKTETSRRSALKLKVKNIEWYVIDIE